MPDKNKETKEKNYIKQYVGESGYTYDATKIRNQLAKEAYQRYIEQDDEELQKEAEENYIMAIYPNEKDEYLVEGAVLTCTMTTRDKKHYRDKVYKVDSPWQTTTLSVTENKKFKCCDLPHATIKDTKKSDDENHNNISPFRCNCMLAPYTEEEWEALEADETCLTEGTCRALMKLNKEWDNLPREDGDECQKISGIPSINMGSILFCRHGGIITPITSGQGKKHNFSDISEFKKEYGDFIAEMIEKYGIQMDVAQIGKIIYVETEGIGFDDFGRLNIRFENHYFLDRIKGDSEKLDAFYAVFQCKEGNYSGHKIKVGGEFISLHPSGTIKDSDLQYHALKYAMEIDEDAAYESISMGVGQIMGSNYEAAGFSSGQEMYDVMSEGYEGQIEGMIRFIKSGNLDEKQPVDFFTSYNGSGNVGEYMRRYDNAIW